MNSTDLSLPALRVSVASETPSILVFSLFKLDEEEEEGRRRRRRKKKKKKKNVEA